MKTDKQEVKNIAAQAKLYPGLGLGAAMDRRH